MWYIFNISNNYINHRTLKRPVGIDTLPECNYIELILRGTRESFVIRKSTTLYGTWIMQNEERLYTKIKDITEIIKDYKIYEWARVLDDDFEDGDIEDCPYLLDIK